MGNEESWSAKMGEDRVQRGAGREGEGRGMQSGRENSESRMRERTESGRGKWFRRRKFECLGCGRMKGVCRLWRKDRAR